MMSILDDHEIIAWDFDGTLWGHEKSELMHAYILAHPTKKHYIITHRSHGEQKLVWIDLEQYPDAPGPEHFVEMINIPDDKYSRFHMSQRSPGGLILLDYNGYIDWKAEMCLKVGATILVDDNPGHTKAGCIKHGIAFVHPDDL